MTIPAVLNDAPGLVNFNIAKGCDKTIRAAYTSTLDLTGWTFEAAIYSGAALDKTVIATTATSTIAVDQVAKNIDITINDSAVAAVADGVYQWDLRYTNGSTTGQILKGKITIGKV